MTWVKIDDHLPTHPKVIGLSDKGFRLYVASICFSSANLTDGEIPGAALTALGGTPKLAAELVDAGLWDTTFRKGWCVHDYLAYNRSKLKAQEISGKRAEAGSKGLAKRWENAKQIATVLPLSGSYSPTSTYSPEKGSLEIEPEQEEQNASNLPSVYRRIDNAWVQAAGTTLPRVAGERFEAYSEKVPVDWVLDAISETGHANKKDPRYTYAILENWMREGREQAPTAEDPFKKSAAILAAARERMS